MYLEIFTIPKNMAIEWKIFHLESSKVFSNLTRVFLISTDISFAFFPFGFNSPSFHFSLAVLLVTKDNLVIRIGERRRESIL